jgi:hypothetical protein
VASGALSSASSAFNPLSNSLIVNVRLPSSLRSSPVGAFTDAFPVASLDWIELCFGSSGFGSASVASGCSGTDSGSAGSASGSGWATGFGSSSDGSGSDSGSISGLGIGFGSCPFCNSGSSAVADMVRGLENREKERDLYDLQERLFPLVEYDSLEQKLFSYLIIFFLKNKCLCDKILII